MGTTVMRIIFAVLLCAAIGSSTAAQESDGRWAILVSGISGDRDLQKQFFDEITTLQSILEETLGFPRDQVFVLFDDPSLDPERIQYKSTRENLELVCRQVSSRAGKEDLVFVFIVGHGNYDGKAYKLNLVGPDPMGEELAAMLDPIRAESLVVVNTTNCSGASLAALAQRGRVVVTATRSGSEKNRPHFAGYFIDALKDNNGDTDKNGRVSVLEAFQFASRQVEEYYTREGSLQSEHSVLDDTGEGKAPLSSASTDDDDRGLIARITYLDSRSPLLAGRDASPEEKLLAREAQSLEKQIEMLKIAKGEMPEQEYEEKLESLLLRLAEVQAKLRGKN